MKTRVLTVLGIIALFTACVLIKSCTKKKSAVCTDCQLQSDARILAKFEPSLGGVDINTEVYYSAITKNEVEIGLTNSADTKDFAKLLSAFSSLLGFSNSIDEKTIAFTIYRNGELHKDSSVLLKDVTGISRYYTKNNKMFHQLFIKNTDGGFSELIDLNAEVDGVVFNYMHAIGLGVLNNKSKSTAFFIRTEDSKDVYKNLENSQDDLKWKLKVYMQKSR